MSRLAALLMLAMPVGLLGQPLSVVTASLPSGTVGQVYTTQNLVASGGEAFKG